MNLILIEGINGSGKSSTTHRLGLGLARLGWDVQWCFEQDEAHPIYPGADRLRYDRAYGETERARVYQETLARWQALAASLSGTKKIVLMESGFLQAVIDHYVLLDLPSADAEAHVLAVEKILAPLDPRLVLLHEEDTAAALRKVLADRSGGWADYLVDLYGRSPCGQAHAIRDFEGVIRAIMRGQALAKAIFDRLALKKLAVDTTAGDWPAIHRRITDFLDVPPLEPPPLPAGADRLVGNYREAGTEDDYRVTFEAGALYVSRQARLRLLPGAGDSYHVLGTRWELGFSVAGNGDERTATLSEEGGGVLGILHRV